MPALEILRIANTPITDAGFREHLMNHPTLKRVDLRGTDVTPETVAEWKAAARGRQAMVGPRQPLEPQAKPDTGADAPGDFSTPPPPIEAPAGAPR